MAATRLGRVQLLIMQVLWDKGRATAREITDAINAIEPIAHSTVQTLLRGWRKRARSRTMPRGGRSSSSRWWPRTSSSKAPPATWSSASSAATSRPLVAHLLKNEKVSRAEVDEIRKLIDRRDKK